MERTLKILAAIFAILFVGTTALAFALYSVEQNAFDAELYIRAMDEENIYQRLPELTAQSLSVAVQRSEDNTMLSLLRNLSEEQWRGVVSELFPPEVLRSLAEEAVTQIMAYLNGERDNVVLPLTSLKVHLQSPEGVAAIYGILKAQPDCTLEQLTAMALNQQALTLCNPPETFLVFDLRPIIENEIKAATSLIPEQVAVVTADSNRIQKLRDLMALRLFMRLSPLVPMLCLLLVTILAVRSWHDWLTWWGYPFLAAGLMSMSLSVLSGPMASLTFRVFIASALPAVIPRDIVNVFRDLTATIVRNAVWPTLFVAGVMALIGLIMIVLAFLFRQRLRKGLQYVR